MWKYSKYLKIPDKNKKINHIHKKNTSAKLQNVEISINSLGMRGDDKDIENWKSSDLRIPKECDSFSKMRQCSCPI